MSGTKTWYLNLHIHAQFVSFYVVRKGQSKGVKSI